MTLMLGTKLTRQKWTAILLLTAGVIAVNLENVIINNNNNNSNNNNNNNNNKDLIVDDSSISKIVGRFLLVHFRQYNIMGDDIESNWNPFYGIFQGCI